MAIKISQLPAATAAQLTDLKEIVQGGLSKKVTTQQDLTLFNANAQITEAQVTNLVADLSSKLNLSGGVMTGFLTLNADPSTALESATKQYVDNSISEAGPYVLKGGDTMTGPLILSANPLVGLGAATKQYVDSAASSLTLQAVYNNTSYPQQINFASGQGLEFNDHLGNPRFAFGETAAVFLNPFVVSKTGDEGMSVLETSDTDSTVFEVYAGTAPKGSKPAPPLDQSNRDLIPTTGIVDYLEIFNKTTLTKDYWDGSGWQQGLTVENLLPGTNITMDKISQPGKAIVNGTAAATPTFQQIYDASSTFPIAEMTLSDSDISSAFTVLRSDGYKAFSATLLGIYSDMGIIESSIDGHSSFRVDTTTTPGNTYLQVLSTNRGASPYPDMTSSQKNSIVMTGARQGLGVYDTDQKSPNLWNGTIFDSVLMINNFKAGDNTVLDKSVPGEVTVNCIIDGADLAHASYTIDGNLDSSWYQAFPTAGIYYTIGNDPAKLFNQSATDFTIYSGPGVTGYTAVRYDGLTTQQFLVNIDLNLGNIQNTSTTDQVYTLSLAIGATLGPPPITYTVINHNPMPFILQENANSTYNVLRSRNFSYQAVITLNPGDCVFLVGQSSGGSVSTNKLMMAYQSFSITNLKQAINGSGAGSTLQDAWNAGDGKITIDDIKPFQVLNDVGQSILSSTSVGNNLFNATIDNGGVALTGLNSGLSFATALGRGSYISLGGAGRNIGIADSGPFFLSANLDYDATAGNYVYDTSSTGMAMEMIPGNFKIKYAASGTGGAAASLTDALTVDSTGLTTLSGNIVSPNFIGHLTGNADTVTNGVVTTGSYADPSWITSLAGSKISGSVANATLSSTVTTNANLSGPVTSIGNTTNITNGSINNDMLAGFIDLAVKVTGTLPFSNGGFGFSTATKGDIFYASATDTPGKLSAPAAGQLIASNGVGAVPVWTATPSVSKISLTTAATDTIQVPNGAGISGKNTVNAQEIFCYPRFTDNKTYFDIGSAGLVMRQNAAGTTWMTVDTSSNMNLSAGSLNVQALGKSLSFKSGANGVTGSFTLSGGTATVTNTLVAATDLIIVCPSVTGGVTGSLPFPTITAGTSIVFNGLATDTSTYKYLLIKVT